VPAYNSGFASVFAFNFCANFEHFGRQKPNAKPENVQSPSSAFIRFITALYSAVALSRLISALMWFLYISGMRMRTALGSSLRPWFLSECGRVISLRYYVVKLPPK